MGLIKNIGNAVKNEVRDYIFKMVENEKEKETAKQSVTENVQKNTEVKAEQPEPEIKEAPVVKEEKVEPEKTEEVEKAVEKPHKKEILPIARDLEILKFSYKKNQNVITIPRELSDLIKMLPLEEYACFIKLYCYSLEQKKNYGYWGGTLKRKIGLDSLTTAEFDEIGNNLVAYGLMIFEKLSEIQKTFVLYIPFDEENMVKLDAAKQPAKQEKTPKKLLKNRLRKRKKSRRKKNPKPSAARTFRENRSKEWKTMKCINPTKLLSVSRSTRRKCASEGRILTKFTWKQSNTSTKNTVSRFFPIPISSRNI